MKLSTKIAYNTIIQFISKILSTILGLVAIAIITRYLGRDGYGEYTTIITFLSFFGIIADMGLTLITVQLISKPNADEKNILSNLLALRLVSAILFLGIAPLTVIFFPYSNEVKLGVSVTTLAYLCIALNQILVGLFQKNLRMDKVSIAEVASRIFLVIGIIVVYKLDYGLMGIMYATIISSVISFLLHFGFSRSIQKISLKFDFDYWKIVVSKSWPLALTITLNLIYLKTDTLILSVLKPVGDVGIYGAAYKVIDVLITIPFMFAGIILPILTKKWAEKNTADFKNILQRSFDLMVIFAIPLAFGTQLIAKDVMVLVAGQEFAEAGPVLQILILAATLIFLGNMFSHAIIAIDKVKKLFLAYLFTAITSVIGYLIFIPKFSYLGAAWMTIYSETAITLAFVFLIYKYTNFLPHAKTLFKSILASCIMMISIFFLQKFYTTNLFVIIPTSALSYFLFLYIFQGINKKDIMILFNR
jgi:O-antigen/teichoic acid export membrane protein